MKVIVRRAGARDFVAVRELDGLTHPPENTDGEHQWRNLIAHGKVLKAEADGRLVGVASLVPTFRPFHFIPKLFVHPQYRGLGVGRLLLERLLEGIDRPVHLTVDPKNEAAIGLYKRLGFKRYRFVKDYYREGEDRYIMRWEGAGKR